MFLGNVAQVGLEGVCKAFGLELVLVRLSQCTFGGSSQGLCSLPFAIFHTPPSPPVSSSAAQLGDEVKAAFVAAINSSVTKVGWPGSSAARAACPAALPAIQPVFSCCRGSHTCHPLGAWSMRQACYCGCCRPQVVRGVLLTKAGYEEKAAAASSLQVRCTGAPSCCSRPAPCSRGRPCLHGATAPLLRQ